MAVSILIVDTEDNLFNKLKPVFEKESIKLIQSKSEAESKIVLDNNDIFLLIISSCNIDNVGKIILASKANDLFRPIIILSEDGRCKKELLPMGINAFYTLPIDMEELIIQSFNLITLYHAKKDSKSQNDVFKTLAVALEVRDPYTHGHGERVAIYATTLYDALGNMDYEEKELLRAGCLIHDVGKIGTPDEILKASKKLDDDEFHMIKNHPSDGVKICLRIVSDHKVLDIIEHHHEKIDGSGYPEGLKREDISNLVQMATVADVYDALTSDRSYRVKNTQDEALKILEEEFVKPGKVNEEYYDKFKELLESGTFENISFI